VRREQRATILDVAARAGVHAATVSRTINVPEKVAPETRRRVEAAVRELGFVPNRAARGLITGRTGNVAVIVPDITNPHFASLVRSVERSARQSDLQVLLVDTGEHPDEEVRAAESLSGEVDGFIVVSPRRYASTPRSCCGRHRPWLTPSSIWPVSGIHGWPTSVDRAGRGRRGSGAARCGAPEGRAG
jgi:DNA-binding LacI/PurR family transcriptional regulator